MILIRKMTPAEMAEFEQKAARGEYMPDNLNGPERSLYISLRGLYYQYRQNIIDKGQAQKEKRQLIKDYELAILDEKAREKSRKLWKALPAGTYKCECPECTALCAIIYGLE